MGSKITPSEIANQYGGWANWYEGEYPQHWVTITKPFFIQTTEVTREQRRVIMTGPRPPLCPDCPVSLSWDAAQKLIQRLNKRENTNKYRLPTEAEWEYACRAGSTTRFCYGNDKDRLGEYAWYRKNSGGHTQPVGQKKPNAWGLYDMHGNVMEWCQDRYGKYPSDSVADPKGSFGPFRVFRGGAWKFDATLCRSAYRESYKPWVSDNYLGLRLARDP